MSAPCPVLGFTVTSTLLPASKEADGDALTDSFIELLEANDLMAGGGGDRVIELVVSRVGGQATDADRQLVLEWACRWQHVAAIAITDIVDLNEPE